MGDPLQALEVPGKLVLGPTDFTAAYPYGGTELGLVKDAAWELVDVYQRVRAEEFGVAVVGDLWCSEAFSIAFALRGRDDAVLDAVWPNTRVGEVSQRRVLYGPGPRRPGALTETAKAAALLFVPDDALNHDAVWLPRALPRRDLRRVPLHLGEEQLLGCVWLAIQGANGLAYEVCRLADLTGPDDPDEGAGFGAGEFGEEFGQ